MKGIALYDRTALAAVVADARQEAEGDFALGYLSAVADTLKQRPGLYRSFGPYWWRLKAELLEVGYKDFGVSLDAETAEALEYGDRETNLAACYVAQQHAMSTLSLSGHFHPIEMQDGTVTEFMIADEEMELVEVGKLVQLGWQVQ